MELQVGVKAILKNKQGKILLVRRDPKKYPEIGAKWDIVGGRINPGISLLENLKREIKEEVGLELVSEPKLLVAQDILRVPGKHVVRLTYLAEIDGLPSTANTDEHLGYGWFTLVEIKNMGKGELDIYFKEVVDKGLLLE